MKKNGKWRVYIDYIDSNKACPKDSFPLPIIEQMVDATASHELLSFIDVYSGYNQIKMHRKREKDYLHYRHAIYYYRVMPFGPKNAGATFQWMVNKVFKELIENMMEVCINNMLLKSLIHTDHVKHLEEVFALL